MELFPLFLLDNLDLYLDAVENFIPDDLLKSLWIKFWREKFQPETDTEPGMLGSLLKHVYQANVQTENKLDGNFNRNNHLCFLVCHAAALNARNHSADPSNLLSIKLSDTKINGSGEQTVMKSLLLDWFAEDFCPHPCASLPCRFDPNAKPESCQPDMLGVWKSSYRCLCKSGFVWDRTLQRCRDKNPCLMHRQESAYPCHPNNTKVCRSVNVTIDCQCNLGFAGPGCHDIYNPCEHTRHPSLPGIGISGNFACRVGNVKGSQCHNIHNYTWSCSCPQPWIQDAALMYDNCAGRYNICESFVCMNGRCRSSQDGSVGICDCSLGWGGGHCERWLGVWSAWTHQDRFRPECGNKRRSISHRRCVVDEIFTEAAPPPFSFCLGESVRVVRCGEQHCLFGASRMIQQSYAVRKFLLYGQLSLATGAAGVLVLLTVWLFRRKGWNLGFKPSQLKAPFDDYKSHETKH